MTLTDKQKTALMSLVLSVVVAVLAIFGYNVVVVQPEIAALTAQVETVQVSVDAMGN